MATVFRVRGTWGKGKREGQPIRRTVKVGGSTEGTTAEAIQKFFTTKNTFGAGSQFTVDEVKAPTPTLEKIINSVDTGEPIPVTGEAGNAGTAAGIVPPIGEDDDRV